MALLRLHHAQISIPVGAEDEARAFYCDVLGLPEIEKPSVLEGRGGLWLDVGNISIHLGVENGVDRAASRAHLAYEVMGLADWRERLSATGIDIVDGIKLPGWERFEFRDPFGNRVELIERERHTG